MFKKEKPDYARATKVIHMTMEDFDSNFLDFLILSISLSMSAMFSGVLLESISYPTISAILSPQAAVCQTL